MQNLKRVLNEFNEAGHGMEIMEFESEYGGTWKEKFNSSSQSFRYIAQFYAMYMLGITAEQAEPLIDMYIEEHDHELIDLYMVAEWLPREFMDRIEKGDFPDILGLPQFTREIRFDDCTQEGDFDWDNREQDIEIPDCSPAGEPNPASYDWEEDIDPSGGYGLHSHE